MATRKKEKFISLLASVALRRANKPGESTAPTARQLEKAGERDIIERLVVKYIGEEDYQRSYQGNLLHAISDLLCVLARRMGAEESKCRSDELAESHPADGKQLWKRL